MIIDPLKPTARTQWPAFIVSVTPDRLVIRCPWGDQSVAEHTLAPYTQPTMTMYGCVPTERLITFGGRPSWVMRVWRGVVTSVEHEPSGMVVYPLPVPWSDDLPKLFDRLARLGIQPRSLTTIAIDTWRSTLTRPRRLRERPGIGADQIIGRHGLYGGRKEARAGTYSNIAHFDLPAAYPSAMAGIRDHLLGIGRTPPADRGTVGVARATVAIPPARWGPLPVRLPDRSVCFGWTSSASHMVDGVWPLRELRAAEDAGCRVAYADVRVAIGETPFASWVSDVVPGLRQLPGDAGKLGKIITARLWGYFALDPRGVHIRVRWTAEGQLTSTSVPRALTPARERWHDESAFVAALTAGAVRERVYREALSTIPGVVYVDTDGVIAPDAAPAPDGWVRKWQARKVEILGAQVYRRWCGSCLPPPDGHAGPHFSVSGVPSHLAARVWEHLCQHPDSMIISRLEANRKACDVTAAQEKDDPPREGTLPLDIVAAG